MIGSVGQRNALVVAVGFIAAISGCGRTRAGEPAPSQYSLQFQAQGLLDADGNPEPSVNSYPDGAAGAIHWSMCPPSASQCTPLAWTNDRTEPGPQPGPQPAGTVFKVTATWKGHRYSSSVRWRGALRVTAPPTLIGKPRFGATVTVHGARWSGGWGTETDDLGIQACRTARATDCVMLAGDYLQCFATGCGVLGGVVGTSRAPDRARVGNWYTGWYLFALAAHLSNGLNGDVGFSSASAIAPWPTNRIVVRSRPYGPVAGPPPPKIYFLPNARVRSKHVLVATLHCAVPCPTDLTVSLKHPLVNKQGVWSAHDVIKGTATIGVTDTLPSGQVSGTLPTGVVHVTVQVGNGPYVTGRSVIH